MSINYKKLHENLTRALIHREYYAVHPPLQPLSQEQLTQLYLTDPQFNARVKQLTAGILTMVQECEE